MVGRRRACFNAWVERLVAFFLDRSLLVNLLSFGLLVAGGLFLLSSQREAFPRVEFDWVLVNTVYPGAAPEDVEKLVSIPLEDELREVDGIEELYSSSNEGFSVLAIKLDPDLKDKQKTINDVKDALEQVADLPADAEEPVVTELEIGMYPILEIALKRKDGRIGEREEFALRGYAKMLEDRLREVDGVARIARKGYRDREMLVEVDPERLDRYSMAINTVVQKLSRKNVNFPGGVVKNPDGEMLIRTIGEVRSADEIARVLIRANDVGNLVRVGDVARVRDTLSEERIVYHHGGRKAVMLTVVKKESADIISLVDRLNLEIEEFKSVLPAEYDISLYNDMSVFVRNRLEVLINNGIWGFIFVGLSLYLALGWRIALVTALGIPLAFFTTFIWIGTSDVTVNMMTMFGLIMVLGMLVDDAIIVAENAYRYLEQGMETRAAVIKGTSEVILPVAGTVLTTIAAFSPLMFMSGIMGRFMWVLPAVVRIALVASWLECMFILPAHIKDMESLAPGKTARAAGHEGGLLTKVKERYGALLVRILHRRYLSFAATTGFFVFSVVFGVVFVKFVLFPSGNIEQFFIKVKTRTGMRLEETAARMAAIEAQVARLPAAELDTFTASVGLQAEADGDPQSKEGAHFGIISVYLTPAPTRERTAEQIIETLRAETQPLQENFESIQFLAVNSGPPVGAAVQVSIKGDDFATLEKISAEYKTFLESVPGLSDVKDDFEAGKDELRVILNDETAEIAGVTVYDVATTIRSFYEGAVASSIKNTDEEIDIRVRFPAELRENPASLERIQVANATGRLIPLRKVSRTERKSGVAGIDRKNWRRTITVTADIDENARDVSSVTVNRLLMEKFSDVERRYPGYTVGYEGEFQDTEESIEELFRSFLIAILIIYIILVAIFRALDYPFIVLSVIPYTFIGVTWVFFFHGRPFSFLALMGVVGLTGVVVNDSIVLVDFIKRGREAGQSPLDAAVNAGVTRLRPVFLTTITTFLGLVPTAYGLGGYDPFLVPMALSLSWGLVFGTLITLFGTPVVYMIFADIKHGNLKALMGRLRRSTSSAL